MSGYADLTEGQRIIGAMATAMPAIAAGTLTHSVGIGIGTFVAGFVLGLAGAAVSTYLCHTDHTAADGSVDTRRLERCRVRSYLTIPPLASALVAWYLASGLRL
jgi:hypothetical protein